MGPLIEEGQNPSTEVTEFPIILYTYDILHTTTVDVTI